MTQHGYWLVSVNFWCEKSTFNSQNMQLTLPPPTVPSSCDDQLHVRDVVIICSCATVLVLSSVSCSTALLAWSSVMQVYV